MVMAAIGAGAALLGSNKQQAQEAPAYVPPPVENPATAAPTTRSANALVRVGDGKAPKTTTATPDYEGFTEKRVFGKSLGGLGRGGLGL